MNVTADARGSQSNIKIGNFSVEMRGPVTPINPYLGGCVKKAIFQLFYFSELNRKINDLKID